MIILIDGFSREIIEDRRQCNGMLIVLTEKNGAGWGATKMFHAFKVSINMKMEWIR